MQKTHKILSFVLAIMMVFSIIPITASAETYSGTCGENLTWTFDELTGTLTISGTGEMDDYYYDYGPPWESYIGDIKKVIIADGVTTIGDSAFDSCSNLTSITIGDGVTTIGDMAFTYCSSLINVTIGNSVTTIGALAFSNCTSLTSVTIPDSVTTICVYAFDSCTALTSLTISDSVTIIGDFAFYNCWSLTSITIPDSVTTIGFGAFDYCFSLTNITVDINNQYYSSDNYGVLFNKDKTTLIQYPIGNTRTSYTIPDSVTTIGHDAFRMCDELTNITIPDSVIVIDSCAFYECYALANIIIGNNVTIIGDNAFVHCESLTDIAIPNSVTTIGHSAFWNCGVTDVFYSGTEEEWNKIDISLYNEYLLNATIHFNYCSHDYKIEITSPTCIEQGYTTYTCACGDSYVNDYIDALGHDFENGTCTGCNATDPDYFTFSIQAPSRTTIKYKDGIVLHVNVNGTLPEGVTIQWTADNSKFKVEKASNGKKVTIISNSNGYTVFTAKVIDANGNELATDTVEMYSKAGFFDKIGGFFRSLFGLDKIYEN